MAWSEAARKASAQARAGKAKGKANKAAAVAKYRVAATIGNESMVMRPKLTPQQTSRAVQEAGQRAKARRNGLARKGKGK
jgi:hypothetical protein